MDIACWSLLFSASSVAIAVVGLAIGAITLYFAFHINRETSKMTETYVRTFISLLVQPAPNSETLQRLVEEMKSTEDTGSFKLEITPINGTDNYRFKWIDQTVSPSSITSAENVPSPTIIQSPPKSSEGE